MWFDSPHRWGPLISAQGIWSDDPSVFDLWITMQLHWRPAIKTEEFHHPIFVHNTLGGVDSHIFPLRRLPLHSRQGMVKGSTHKTDKRMIRGHEFSCHLLQRIEVEDKFAFKPEVDYRLVFEGWRWSWGQSSQIFHKDHRRVRFSRCRPCFSVRDFKDYRWRVKVVLGLHLRFLML